MTNRELNPQQLYARAIDLVSKLEEVARKEKRVYSPDIQVVHIHSGPGTYYDKLKASRPEEEWMRWMDRDRIRGGFAIARAICAARKLSQEGKSYDDIIQDAAHHSRSLTEKDMAQYAPFIFYNGIPEENAVLRKALQTDTVFLRYPRQKIVIEDTVEDENGIHPIRHTGDQVKSLYQHIAHPASVFYKSAVVAVVADVTHFTRVPFYLEKYNSEYVLQGGRPVQYWFYGIRNRQGAAEPHLQHELERLDRYAQQGDLALNPIAFRMR